MILSEESLRRDVDRAVFPFMQGGPMMHAIAAKAVCLGEAMQPDFKAYGRQVVANAKALATTLEGEGLRIVSGGTDTHLMLVDLRALECTGQEAEDALSNVNITVNKNAIPNDPQPARVTSGLRLGTPSITSRGFKEKDVQQMAQLIVRALNHRGDEQVAEAIRQEVEALTNQFPVPGLDV